MFVREVTLPVIAIAGQVVGDVENSPRRIRQIGLRSMRNEAVEENDIPGSGRYRLQVQALLLERLPLLADEPLTMAASRHFQAAVLQGRRIERHHGGDKQRRIHRPTGLLILVRLEAGATGHLEVDFVLEQDHGSAHERTGPADQGAVANEPVEAGVIGAEVLDPLDHAPPWRGHAVFAINPVAPGYLRRALELRGPLQELRELLGADEIAHH